MAQHDANKRLAVQQFTIKGPRHTRRPDIILCINGLPLVLVELKNPAYVNADIWKAYDQIQTYKEQIADVFTDNELLVISDGTEARICSEHPVFRQAKSPAGTYQTLSRGPQA